MAILKSAETFLSSQSVPAGTTVTGSPVDLRAKYGSIIHSKVTNGGTGPSTPPEVSLEVSNDNFATDVHEVRRAYGSTLASAVTEHEFRVLPEVMYARIKVKAGTGQASTFAAAGSSVLSVF